MFLRIFSFLAVGRCRCFLINRHILSTPSPPVSQPLPRVWPLACNVSSDCRVRFCFDPSLTCQGDKRPKLAYAMQEAREGGLSVELKSLIIPNDRSSLSPSPPPIQVHISFYWSLYVPWVIWAIISYFSTFNTGRFVSVKFLFASNCLLSS